MACPLLQLYFIMIGVVPPLVMLMENHILPNVALILAVVKARSILA
jgi:hypothetical protein